MVNQGVPTGGRRSNESVVLSAKKDWERKVNGCGILPGELEKVKVEMLKKGLTLPRKWFEQFAVLGKSHFCS